MKIESINTSKITDPATREVISQLAECIFELSRDIKKTLNHLTSQNVKEIDFNITGVKNIDSVLKDYATKTYVDSKIT